MYYVCKCCYLYYIVMWLITSIPGVILYGGLLVSWTVYRF
jgi:hypothetical protein